MHEPSDPSGSARSATNLAAAGAIGVGALVGILAMALHPSVGAHGLAEGMAEIRREAHAAGVVHGAMIAVLGAWIFGYWVFADRLGLGRSSVRLGLVAFVMGAAAHVGAATISGFVTPSFAASHGGTGEAELETAHRIMAYGFHINQALAKLGVVTMSVAFLCWSAVLLRRAGLARGIGVAGIAVGAFPLLAVAAGHLRLNVHGMGLVLLVQALWSLGVAWLLIRERRERVAAP